MRRRQAGILSMQPPPFAFSWFPFVFVELGRQKVGKMSAKSRQKVGKIICRDLAESCCTWNLFQWFSLVFDSLHSMLYGFVGQCVADRLESSPCNLPHLHLVGFPLYLWN